MSRTPHGARTGGLSTVPPYGTVQENPASAGVGGAMNRRLLTAVGAAALIVATVMPMGVTAARAASREPGEALRARRHQQDRQVADQVDPVGPRRQRDRRDDRPVRDGARRLEGPAGGRRRTAQGPPGRPRPLGAEDGRHGRGQVPVRVQRHQGARPEPQDRGPGDAARRQGDPPGPDVHGRQPPQRAVHRRPGRVAGLRRHRQRPDDRRHRHRHRLHARQLRRGRHRGRVRRQRLDDHRARHLPDREGHRRLGLRR